MKTREAQCKYMSTREIYHLLAAKCDIVYFSARKLGFARGGIITSVDRKYTDEMMEYIPLYEGFLTYGGMEVRSMEAIPRVYTRVLIWNTLIKGRSLLHIS